MKKTIKTRPNEDVRNNNILKIFNDRALPRAQYGYQQKLDAAKAQGYNIDANKRAQEFGYTDPGASDTLSHQYLENPEGKIVHIRRDVPLKSKKSTNKK
jgi:hypothetical protein